MAHLVSGIQFTGSLGNVSAYRMKGSDKIVLRTKGGPSKKMVATGKQFDITRRNNNEFSRRAKGSALILNAMSDLRRLADYKISAALNAVLKQIQALDTTSVFGERDIFLSRRPGLLEGFSFNREITFDATLLAPLRVSIDDLANRVTVVLPEIVHGTNFRTDGHYPWCRFVLAAACVPDLEWRDNGFPGNVPRGTSQTEWQPAMAEAAERRVELSFAPASNRASTLVVGIGLQYGVVSPSGEIVPVNFGCAKILLAKALGS
ncbi:MAG: hypothetical protein QM762_06195 [Chryseolinea sp.]